MLPKFLSPFFCKPAPPYTVDLCTTHHQLDTKITFPILCSNLSKAIPPSSLPCLPSKCKSQISVKFSGWVRQDFKRSWLLLTRRYSMHGNISCGAAGNWINQNSFWPIWFKSLESTRKEKATKGERARWSSLRPSPFSGRKLWGAFAVCLECDLMDSPHLHLLRMFYIFLHFLHSSVKIPVFQHYPKVAAVTSHRQQTHIVNRKYT